MNSFIKSKYFIAFIIFSPISIMGMSLKDLSAKKFAEYLLSSSRHLNQITNISSLPIELNNKINGYLLKSKIIAFAIKQYLIKNKQYNFEKKSLENFDEIHFFKLGPKTDTIAVNTNHGLQLYNFEQKSPLKNFGECRDLSFCSNNSCFFILDHVENLKIYDVKNYDMIVQLKGKSIKAAVFSNDGLFLSAVYSDNTIHTFSVDLIKESNFEEKFPVIALKNAKRYPSSIIWTSNNKLLAAIFKKSLEIYEVDTGKLIFQKKFPGKRNNIQVSISLNSKYFAIADNRQFKSYIYRLCKRNLDSISIEQDKPCAVLNQHHSGEILSLDFSSDGAKLLEISMDGFVSIYKLNELDNFDKEQQILLEPKKVIKSKGEPLDGKFSPDSALFAIACHNGLIYIYNADSGELLTKLEGQEIYDYNLLKFDSSGYLTTLVGKKYDKINIYDLSFADLKEKIYNLKPIEILLLLKCYNVNLTGEKLNLCSCQNNYFSTFYNKNKEEFSAFLVELIEPYISKKCDKCSK